MKKISKIVALLLAVIMMLGTLTILAGCEAKSDYIQLTCYSQLANYNGKLQGWFADIIREKFNAEITVIPDADGVYATRMQSGDLGDIVVWGNNGDQYMEAVAAGMLYDWEKYDLVQTHGSYIYENMNTALEHNRDLSGTGTVYGFGHNVASSSESHDAFFYTWDLRFDLYKQLGYPEIKDLDDLFDVFVQMKEICPTGDDGNETYAVSIWPDWDGDMVMYVKSTATAYYGYDEFGFGLYDPATGIYHDALDPEGPYVEMLRWYNKLYIAGLVDPDSPTQTYDVMSEKLENGRVFFSIFNYAGYMTYNKDKHTSLNKGMYTVVPDEANPIVYGLSPLGGNRIWSIGSKTAHADVCMQIINWLCTPEGRITTDYGPKGLCWDYDENGKTYLTEIGLICKTDPKVEMSTITDGQYSGKFTECANQMNNTTWTSMEINPESGEPYNCEYWASYTASAKPQIELDWQDWASKKFGTEISTNQEYLNNCNYTVAPDIGFAMGLMDDELEFKYKSIKDKIKTGSYNCLTSKSEGQFERMLTNMINECNALGYQECVEFYEAEAERRHQLEEEFRAATGN